MTQKITEETILKCRAPNKAKGVQNVCKKCGKYHGIKIKHTVESDGKYQDIFIRANIQTVRQCGYLRRLCMVNGVLQNARLRPIE